MAFLHRVSLKHVKLLNKKLEQLKCLRTGNSETKTRTYLFKVARIFFLRPGLMQRKRRNCNADCSAFLSTAGEKRSMTDASASCRRAPRPATSSSVSGVSGPCRNRADIGDDKDCSSSQKCNPAIRNILTANKGAICRSKTIMPQYPVNKYVDDL